MVIIVMVLGWKAKMIGIVKMGSNGYSHVYWAGGRAFMMMMRRRRNTCRGLLL